MASNLLTYPHFLLLFLRLKLLGHTSRFPPLPGGVLDEQTSLLRRAQVVLGETPLEQLTPAVSRENFRGTFALLKKIGGIFEPVASTRDLLIPTPAASLPARLYLPDERKDLPLFLYFHGGGWVIGDLETGDNLARFICRHAGCAVLSVEYRLAPEHPFPAAVADAQAALQWAAANAPELNGNPSRLLVGGDSAGGTLSAVAARLAVQQGGPRLAGQALFYPGANCASLDTPSYRQFGEASYGLPRRDVEWFLKQYLPDPSQRLDPRASPLLAPDLRGLPPALVVTAEYDVLRDEGEAYAHRMQEAGVDVRLLRCNGMVHGFLSMIGLLKRATHYFETVATEIRRLAAP